MHRAEEYAKKRLAQFGVDTLTVDIAMDVLEHLITSAYIAGSADAFEMTTAMSVRAFEAPRKKPSRKVILQ